MVRFTVSSSEFVAEFKNFHYAPDKKKKEAASENKLCEYWIESPTHKLANKWYEYKKEKDLTMVVGCRQIANVHTNFWLDLWFVGVHQLLFSERSLNSGFLQYNFFFLYCSLECITNHSEYAIYKYFSRLDFQLWDSFIFWFVWWSPTKQKQFHPYLNRPTRFWCKIITWIMCHHCACMYVSLDWNVYTIFYWFEIEFVCWCMKWS